MKGDLHSGIKNAKGFSMIEVMVVMLIAGILAYGIAFMFTNPNATVKSHAFTILGELNMARSEAVRRNQNVLVDFIEGAEDGYQLCIDATPAGPPAGNNLCSDEVDENFILETLFRTEVQFYDPASNPPKGPSATPGGGSLIGSSGIVLDDNTAVTSIIMEPDGTLEDTVTQNANVVIFIPEEGNHNKIYGTPYAVTIKPNGGISIGRWIMGDTWFRK